MTHPGVGPGSRWLFVLTIGDVEPALRGASRWAAIVGLIPSEESSVSTGGPGRRKQAGQQPGSLAAGAGGKPAQSSDASWHRQYMRLSMNKHHGVAKVAIAHKLAVRLYWMLRTGQNYEQ